MLTTIVGRGIRRFEVAVLRKRRCYPLYLLLLVNPIKIAACESAKMSATGGDGSHRINIADGLLLYYNEYSFYSQKVVLALHEKGLRFDTHSINLARYGQYEPWFLQINPKGEVPVLQDTGKIIPDSARIIDYLEDNFSNGDTPRLIPMEPEVRQRVTYFRGIIDKINGNVITIGSFIHPETASNPKLPFIGPVRSALLQQERNSSVNLKKIAESNPEARDMLLRKAADHELKFSVLEDKEEFLKVLREVDAVLDQVEAELGNHEGDSRTWWLCSDRFTVADISLTMLLERIYEVGLESRFWTGGKRPRVEEYFARVRERDSYRNTIPSTMFFVKMVFASQAPLFIGLGVVTAIAVLVGGFFVVRRMYK
ncbi:ganglioside-induced differentiation-associated protein 1 [Cylas formicarius]|uniref:ganglioside-induced differentiation-associated protein 1 n=1 Tax=Cylas formicarius TaxID=197179 RepID=UPI00295836B2|nr:ganglioside-induced differentiation-associated protein 1 [Cylas formicarius]